MKKKVYLVTSTRCKTLEEFQKRPLAKSLDKLYKLYDRDEFDFHIIKDNQEGLSKAYNKFITEEYKDCIVLFIHDDVIIRDLFLVEHLRKSPYVVTGLAGTQTVSSKAEKAAWHLMGDPKSFVGEVAHIKDNKIWTTAFGPTQGRAKIVDGVFVAVNIEQILNTSARFNEVFNWHHYDMAFCLECVKNNVSIGVIPISIIHYGLGDSMLSADWEESSKRFKDVYCKL
jgi:hypothetical protein